jgi:hypothetical protein
MTEIPSAIPAAPIAPPANVAEAITRRAELEADPKFREKYRAHDIASVSEMKALNNFISEQKPDDRLGAVMAGTHKPGMIETTTREHPLTSSELASAVDGLRKDGYSDQIIKEIIEGTPVTAARHAEAAALQERLIKDREWVRRYRAGEVDYVQQMRRIVAVLAAPIEDSK